jgi:tripartite-type tricarboxylate transporter receptor subunit TctC
MTKFRTLSLTRRDVGKAMTGGLIAGLAPQMLAPAQAAGYPDQSVTIIVPFAAGGSADVFGRILAQQLQKLTGQSFIVEDRPGAGSIIGTEAVARSTPNGYTLLVISNTHTVNTTLFPHTPYKLLTSFEPIAPINAADLVLVTSPKLGVKTLPALIALAKKEPGKLTFASSGPGTPYHMAGELFKQMAGIDILHVPYKGSSGARIAVIGGQVDMMFDAIATMAGLIKSGKVVGIATTGTKRSKVLPNLPTMAEAGVPGYSAPIWLGLVAPAGTPKPIVDKLNGLISKIEAEPAIRESWEKQGATPVIMKPAQFRAFIAADIKKWAGVIKAAHIRVNG